MTKAEIINEIKRTTAENGGIPLGWRKFATETGIRDSDWMGKYWARWSEALKDAGYEPNEMTKAHGETALLDNYAKLALQFGRLPAEGTADLRPRFVFQFMRSWESDFGSGDLVGVGLARDFLPRSEVARAGFASVFGPFRHFGPGFRR
jgi:hypothetical protein